MKERDGEGGPLIALLGAWKPVPNSISSSLDMEEDREVDGVNYM